MRCLWIMFVTAVCFLFLLKLKWPKNKNIYEKLSSSKKHTQFKNREKKPYHYLRPQRPKSISCLWPKRLKHHTLWGCTYLYRPYKGIPPGGFLATVERFFRKFLYFDCCVTPVLIFRVRLPTCFTSKHEKLERWLDLIILKCHPTYINQLRMYLLVGSLNSFAIVYRL